MTYKRLINDDKTKPTFRQRVCTIVQKTGGISRVQCTIVHCEQNQAAGVKVR